MSVSAAVNAYTNSYGFAKINFDYPRWHTTEWGNWDLLDTLLKSVGVAPTRGAWTNATLYTIGDKVVDTVGNASYSCNVTHTSANAPTTFVQDRTTNPTYWTLYTPVIPYHTHAIADVIGLDSRLTTDENNITTINTSLGTTNGVVNGILANNWVTAARIANDAVDNSKLANMAANTIKGAVTAGDPVDLTPAQIATILGFLTSSGGGQTSVVLPGGITLKAGSAITASNGALSVAFAAPFTTVVYAVVAVPIVAPPDTSFIYAFTIGHVDKNYFDAYFRYSNVSGVTTSAVNFYWIAIGT